MYILYRFNPWLIYSPFFYFFFSDRQDFLFDGIDPFLCSPFIYLPGSQTPMDQVVFLLFCFQSDTRLSGFVRLSFVSGAEREKYSADSFSFIVRRICAGIYIFCQTILRLLCQSSYTWSPFLSSLYAHLHELYFHIDTLFYFSLKNNFDRYFSGGKSFLLLMLGVVFFKFPCKGKCT